MFKPDLLVVLQSLKLNGSVSTWTLQNDGQRISLSVEWDNSRGPVGFRPNTTSLQRTSFSGFQKKAPSTLRRDQSRMQEFVEKKQHLLSSAFVTSCDKQRQETEGGKSMT